jgi:hypothetical protein
MLQHLNLQFLFKSCTKPKILRFARFKKANKNLKLALDFLQKLLYNNDCCLAKHKQTAA